MVSSGIRWFLLILVFVSFGSINANNFIEVKSESFVQSEGNFSIKLILIDKSFESDIMDLWEFYQFNTIGVKEVRDFAKNITKIYERNGYFIPKIHYRKLDNIVYLIVPKTLKQKYRVKFMDSEKSISRVVHSSDSIKIYLDKYLTKLRNDGFLFPSFSLDSIHLESDIVIANFSLDKADQFPLNDVIITPKKFNNKQIKSFFMIDSIFTHESVELGVNKLNNSGMFSVEKPTYFYDSTNQGLVSKISLVSNSYDKIDVMLGADTSSIVGSIDAVFNNLGGRINNLNVNLFKHSTTSEEVTVEYGMLLSKDNMLSISGKFEAARKDSISGYIGGEVGGSMVINDNIKLSIPLNYNYYYYPKVSTLVKSGLGISRNGLKDDQMIVGGLYDFQWLVGVNNSQTTKFSRDIKAKLIGGIEIFTLNFIGKISYLNYSYPEYYLVPVSVIDGNIFRGVLPYSEVIPELYSINSEMHKYFFSNLGAYLFTDFLYYKNILNSYESKLGIGVGFELLKGKNRIKIDVGTDILEDENEYILSINFIFGI